MNFTPKTDVRPIIRGILTIAVVGLIGWWGSQFALAPAPIAESQNSFTLWEPPDTGYVTSFDTGYNVAAIETSPGVGLQTAGPEHYQPAAWYKNKHWWKRNAPIVGGAAGGALIGGFLGGGKGAIIGGAAGGGGGYLYKRTRHHHHHYHHHH